MKSLQTLLFACVMALSPGILLGAEELLQLSDGVAVKVLFFEPKESIKSPPLALLIAGGSSNEFMARAQFWLGRELVDRGWSIAVPISPDGNGFSEHNAAIFPEIINQLHASHDLKPGGPLLVGISSGGSAALEIAAQNPTVFAGVVATPGRISPSTSIKQLEGLPIYLRIGEKDKFRWDRNFEESVDVLYSAGASVDGAIVPDARHIFSLDWDNLQQWLEGLDESR